MFGILKAVLRESDRAIISCFPPPINPRQKAKSSDFQPVRPGFPAKLRAVASACFAQE